MKYRIRQARERLGITQQQLAKLAKLNPMAVSHFECGRCLPSCKNLAALAVALCVSADWLLGIGDARKFVFPAASKVPIRQASWPRTQRISLRPGPEFQSRGKP